MADAPRFRVQSQFLQQVRARFGKLARWVLLLIIPLVLLRACLVTYVPPDQIGVRQIAFGVTKGLQKEAVYPGWRREVSGFERIETFPRNIQVVEFTNNSQETSEGHRQMAAIRVPTVDGYPVDIDVTVQFRIADPYLVVSKFGFGKNYEDAAVVRLTDPLAKQYLGDLLAEEFYKHARLNKVKSLKAALQERLKANGLHLVDVLVRQYDYPETFQTLTEQRKLQDQSVLTNRELAKQAEVQTRLNQVIAQGQNLVNVETAKFEAQITEINAKKDLYERQKHAEADLLVKSAEASGTEAINRALEGSGSSKLLRLRRGLALLDAIHGPIYITEDPTNLDKYVGGNQK